MKHRLDGRSYHDRIGQPYYGHKLRAIISPEPEDAATPVERVTEWWNDLASSRHFWRVLTPGILASLLCAALIVVNAAPLRFEYAETPQPAPTLRSNVIAIPIAPSPVELDRRCSLPGELQQCETYCGSLGRKLRPEPGWGPTSPITLRSIVAPPSLLEPHQSVRSCDVRTIDGQMTLVCECFDPSIRT